MCLWFCVEGSSAVITDGSLLVVRVGRVVCVCGWGMWVGEFGSIGEGKKSKMKKHEVSFYFIAMV
jgi:hypothetical protein